MFELCFMSNLSSAEWAAWVQAVGSIAAIVAAIFIAQNQRRADLRRELENSRHRRKKAEKLCVAFGIHLLECFAEIRRASEFNNPDIFERQAHRLNDLALFA